MRWLERIAFAAIGFVLCLAWVTSAPESAVQESSADAIVQTVDEKIECTVYITKSGEKYHRGGCSYLKSRIPITIDDAIENGYTMCKRCKP